MKEKHSGAHEIRVGIDTGGTHTDVVLANMTSGEFITCKVPSTRDDLSVGIMEGVTFAAKKAGVDTESIRHFVYATTMVTNLLIEEVNTPVGLITTEGFRDVLEIGKASRKPSIYDIQWRPARPLVDRPLRLEVTERVSSAGEVLTELDIGQARAALSHLVDRGCLSVAVCFINSYANPVHEQQIQKLVTHEFPSLEVSISSDIIREFREFERTSTAVLNAFVKRPLGKHLEGLQDVLVGEGIPAQPFIMRGNGGISTFAVASQTPVAVTHSGPMGGIVGGAALAKAYGVSNLITLDMGGTSADVSVVVGGEPSLTPRAKLGAYPLLLPMLDLVTIGAGGGSIARAKDGHLTVGPQSAGSRPGPACYGLGGLDPTVTDANVLASRLNPGYFLDGRGKLLVNLAERALMEGIGKPLGITLDQAALGIIAIAESHMVNAIKLISVERGLDPRDFTLVGFGGAGPLHTLRLAEELAITSCLIPPAPGNVSAMGLLSASVRHDLVQTRVAILTDIDPKSLDCEFLKLVEESDKLLDRDGIELDRRIFLKSVDLRYRGQNYELSMPCAVNLDDPGQLDIVLRRFNDEHQRVYGYTLPDRPVQLVNLRVTAIGQIAQVDWPRVSTSENAADPIGHRQVLIDSQGRHEIPVYRQDSLGVDQRIAGPAIVEYAGSTLFVPPHWTGHYDAMRSGHFRYDRRT